MVLQFIENINISHTSRRIFVVTPERAEDLFAQIDQFNIQLILFDEAQIVEDDIRGMRFDVIVRKCHRLLPNAKKIFAHPFVNNPEIQITRNQLGENSCSRVYKQQSVGKLFVSKKNNQYSIFSPFDPNCQRLLEGDFIYEMLKNTKDGKKCTVLIYVSKTLLYKEDSLKVIPSSFISETHFFNHVKSSIEKHISKALFLLHRWFHILYNWLIFELCYLLYYHNITTKQHK